MCRKLLSNVRGGDLAVVQAVALDVTGLVNRGEHFLADLGGLFQDRVDQVVAGFFEAWKLLESLPRAVEFL